MRLERATLAGEIVEVKEMSINGVPVGIVKGYIATWQKDHYPGIYGVPDRIVKGAYTRTLQEHKARNNRQIRLKDNHGRTIGGFPIDTAREDNIGLYAEGHINLDTQLGKEAYSLARQRVLVDFSVGHIVKKDTIENGERLIYDADLIEGSITDEPKNRWAKVSEVKSAHFADLLSSPVSTTGMKMKRVLALWSLSLLTAMEQMLLLVSILLLMLLMANLWLYLLLSTSRLKRLSELVIRQTN